MPCNGSNHHDAASAGRACTVHTRVHTMPTAALAQPVADTLLHCRCAASALSRYTPTCNQTRTYTHRTPRCTRVRVRTKGTDEPARPKTQCAFAWACHFQKESTDVCQWRCWRCCLFTQAALSSTRAQQMRPSGDSATTAAPIPLIYSCTSLRANKGSQRGLLPTK